jgi:glucose-6-phosphate isomerase
VAPVRASSQFEQQQTLALANCFAQVQAFAFGVTDEEITADLRSRALKEDEVQRLLPHKRQPGNRATSVILFRRLGPKTLGKLIALYEQKVFTQSVIWNINAFDQWGVELGKKLADKLAPQLADPARAAGDDATLRVLLTHVAEWRG